jgi:SOS response regulatory protein OraA/RecX
MPFGRKSAKPKPMLNEAGLYDYGVKALGRRMRSVSELHRLMKARVEPARLARRIVSVLGRLKEHGYLDDASLCRDVCAAAAGERKAWRSAGAAGSCSRRAWTRS